MPDLPVSSFILVAVLFGFYAVAGGLDAGVGMLQISLGPGDRDRALWLGSVAPVTDGNQVWLFAGACALFAAFPRAYATLFSGFYLAFTVIAFALVLRTVLWRLRETVEGPSIRRFCELAAAFGSAAVPFLLGAVLANALRGVPLSAGGEIVRPMALLDPFAVLVGLLTVALCVQQGAAWLALKAGAGHTGPPRRAAFVSWLAVVIVWIAAVPAAHAAAPRAFAAFGGPVSWLAPVLFHLSLLAFPLSLVRSAVPPFAISSAGVLALAATAAVGLYPNLVPALGAPERSLTIWNTAAAPQTLGVALGLAVVGIPVALASAVVVYRFFRGPMGVPEESA